MKYFSLMFATLICFFLTISCGDKKSNFPGPGQGGGSIDLYNDPSGYLVFSPKPGTYFDDVKVTVRPRTLNSKKNVTFQIMNADTSSCSNEGNTARCLTLKKTKALEYTVTVESVSLLTGEPVTELHTGSVTYTIEKGTPPPPPGAPKTVAQLDVNEFTHHGTVCQDNLDTNNTQIQIALGNDTVIGKLNRVWFTIKFNRDRSQGTELKVSNKENVALSNIRGNADQRPSINESGDMADVTDAGCIVNIKADSDKERRSGLQGDLECTLKKISYFDGTYPFPEEFKIKVTDWYCP